MKVRILKRNLIILVLCLYFISKMLWDSFFFGMFEAISIILICYGIFQYFSRSTNYKYISIIALFIVFFIYIFIECFFNGSEQYTFRAIYEYIFYTSIIFAMSYYLEKCDLVRLIHKIYIFGLIIAVLSWYEYLTKSYLIGSFRNTIQYRYSEYTLRAAVFSRSYLSHGVVLGFITLCAFYLFLKTEKKRYFFSTLFCWISILTTSSRGPLVSTFIALVLAYIMNQYRISKKIDKKLLVWFGISCLAIVVLVFLNSSFTTKNEIINYFFYRTRQIINWSGDAGNIGRLSIWKRTMEWFKTDIFFGIGPSKTGSWGKSSIGVTESGVLKRLCELGIIGFIIYYLFIYLILKNGIYKYKRLTEQEKISFILFFSVTVLVLVNDITLQSTEEIMVSFIYAFGLGGLIIDCESNQVGRYKLKNDL